FAPAPRASLRVHGPAGAVQDQPVPAIAVAVRPAGTVSVTVTAPLLAPSPLLCTVILYVAPVCPCVKFPLCVFVIVKSGNCMIVVVSFAVLLPVLISPPPDTLAVLVTLAA